MRGLIVCIAVVCLAFANGAPSDEKSAVYTKNFNYDKKEVIYSLTPFSKDELVYAVCESSSDEKQCKVYVESANEDQTTVRSCDLNLKYTGMFVFQVSLFNAGNSRAVFAIQDGEAKFNVFSVNLKGCQISAEASFVEEKQNPQFPGLFEILFVAHENNYDIFYSNQDLCHDFYCKATIDYEGQLVKAVSEFPLKYVPGSFYRIASAGHAYFIGEITQDESNVYLVKDGDNKSNKLYSGPRSFIGLSTEENKLGFCVHDEQKLVCKQYDAEGKNKIIDMANLTGEGRLNNMDVLNLEKGFLALTVESRKSSDDRTIFAIHFDEQGKQGKYVNLGFACDRKLALLSKLYKNSNGQYCITSICLKPLDSKENKSEFSRNSRCFLNSELF